MSPETTGRKFNLRIVIGLIVLVLGLILILQNTEQVTINFLSFDITTWLWLLLAVMFVLGMLLGGAVRGGIRKLRGRDAHRS